MKSKDVRISGRQFMGVLAFLIGSNASAHLGESLSAGDAADSARSDGPVYFSRISQDRCGAKQNGRLLNEVGTEFCALKADDPKLRAAIEKFERGLLSSAKDAPKNGVKTALVDTSVYESRDFDLTKCGIEASWMSGQPYAQSYDYYLKICIKRAGLKPKA